MRYETQDTATTGEGKVVRVEGISWKLMPPVALLAALFAAVVNTIVYFAASGLGFIPQDALVPMGSGEMPLTASVVAIASVIGAIGGAVVFALIGLLAGHPLRLFRIVATVALVLSLAMPLTIPGAPTRMVLSLMVMHVATWTVTVGLLTVPERRKELTDG